jgi:hypothetical protein
MIVAGPTTTLRTGKALTTEATTTLGSRAAALKCRRDVLTA